MNRLNGDEVMAIRDAIAEEIVTAGELTESESGSAIASAYIRIGALAVVRSLPSSIGWENRTLLLAAVNESVEVRHE